MYSKHFLHRSSDWWNTSKKRFSKRCWSLRIWLMASSSWFFLTKVSPFNFFPALEKRKHRGQVRRIRRMVLYLLICHSRIQAHHPRDCSNILVRDGLVSSLSFFAFHCVFPSRNQLNHPSMTLSDGPSFPRLVCKELKHSYTSWPVRKEWRACLCRAMIRYIILYVQIVNFFSIHLPGMPFTKSLSHHVCSFELPET